MTNQEVANRIDNMKLSEKARHMVDSTEIRLFVELFGGCSAADLEELANEFDED